MLRVFAPFAYESILNPNVAHASRQVGKKTASDARNCGRPVYNQLRKKALSIRTRNLWQIQDDHHEAVLRLRPRPVVRVTSRLAAAPGALLKGGLRSASSRRRCWQPSSHFISPAF